MDTSGWEPRTTPDAREEAERSMWLSRCVGFRVEAPGGRALGSVVELRFGARLDRPDALVVRGGLLGRRTRVVSADEVESIDPVRQLVVVATERHADVRTLRIVIAEDNPDVREVLGKVFEVEPGFEVVATAPDGIEAVELTEALRPDLLLLDLAMPKLDGFQVMERLRSSAPEVRIVVFSGFADVDVQVTARRIGAADYLEKGTSPVVMVERLRQVGAR